MTEQEKILHFKTSKLLNRDTSRMKLNDIIEELVYLIENSQETKLEEESELIK